MVAVAALASAAVLSSPGLASDLGSSEVLIALVSSTESAPASLFACAFAASLACVSEVKKLKPDALSLDSDSLPEKPVPCSVLTCKLISLIAIIHLKLKRQFAAASAKINATG